jgi:CubicO group peptidase (beta-lactamase class C family)
MHSCVVTALLFLASPTAAEGTPAAAKFTALMAEIDGGDEARLRSWVLENFTAEMLRANPGDPGIAQFVVDQQRNLGGFEVLGVLQSHPSQVEVHVRARKGARRDLRYVVSVEPEPPHRIAGIFVFPMAGEVLPAEGEPLTQEAAVAALEREIDRLADGGRFAGAVLLAKDGKPVLRKAWGEAERSFHAPNRPDTLFSLGSLNKMFTAVAIGRLVDEGKVAWDDPVGTHVEGWLSDDLAAKITIRHLLTHTSGLGDFLDRLRDGDSRLALDGVAAHRRLVEGSRPAFEPGSRFQYSNAGYLLLGAVIEAVSRRDYYSFVHDEVYARAGMVRSGSYAMDDVIENLAVGYIRPGEGVEVWKTNRSLGGVRGTPAGGGYSTCDDLLAFSNALLGNRLLTKATTEAILTPRVTAPFGEYGFGFGVEKAPGGGTVVGHAGGFPGVSTVLRVYRATGWTLCVLANVSSGPGEIARVWDGLIVK